MIGSCSLVPSTARGKEATDGQGRASRDPGSRRGTSEGVHQQTRIPTEPGALKRIETGGGVVVQPRIEIPTMGPFACFKDTEGNVVGSWETS